LAYEKYIAPIDFQAKQMEHLLMWARGFWIDGIRIVADLQTS
jgi:hypothetical protein